eukprot:m.93033 g.93033  ORF g.93033 m.93033 type:complete len:62 (+) comp12096_c0_seq2:2037-2222(+)
MNKGCNGSGCSGNCALNASFARKSDASWLDIVQFVIPYLVLGSAENCESVKKPETAHIVPL